MVDRGEAAIGVERDDRVGCRFDEVAVARLGTGERLLGTLGIGDVAEGGDGADDFAVHAEGSARHGHVALFAGRVIHDAGFVALRLSSEDLVLA